MVTLTAWAEVLQGVLYVSAFIGGILLCIVGSVLLCTLLFDVVRGGTRW